MCGIAGCTGHEKATDFVMQGLEALEYRGYDSAGIAYIDNGQLEVVKSVGRISSLQTKLLDHPNQAEIAIGHTRWATHGEPSELNAHPHTNTDRSIALVHNGIIENHQILKRDLETKGYLFKSETDTEVIPHLLDSFLKESGDPEEAFGKTINSLVGAYAILACFVYDPDRIYAARLSSPLLIGVNGHGRFVASDQQPISKHTKKVIYLSDNETAVISPDDVSIKNTKNGINTSRGTETLEHEHEQAELGDFPNFMLKEIYDSPETVRLATKGRIHAKESLVRLGGLNEVKNKLFETERIMIVACGTSYFAGCVGEQLIEEIAGIPVEVQLASEFKDRDEPMAPNTTIIAISQSGETADTIAALKKVDDYGVLKLGIVNVPGSTISRVTDAGVYCHAGPELAVASTKAFTAQVTVLSELALKLCKGGNKLYKPMLQELEDLPRKIETLLGENSEQIESLAEKYADYKNFLFLGRNYNYPVAMEGALKLKEISYIHAEGYSAGEMKHGPLALIDEGFPTLAIALDGKLYEKTISNIQEIRARKGPVLAIATEGNEDIRQHVDDVIYIPETLEQTQPILAGIALQLFACRVAMHKGLDVDRPRNLAKSVTVE